MSQLVRHMTGLEHVAALDKVSVLDVAGANLLPGGCNVALAVVIDHGSPGPKLRTLVRHRRELGRKLKQALAMLGERSVHGRCSGNSCMHQLDCITTKAHHGLGLARASDSAPCGHQQLADH